MNQENIFPSHSSLDCNKDLDYQLQLQRVHVELYQAHISWQRYRQALLSLVELLRYCALIGREHRASEYYCFLHSHYPHELCSEERFSNN